MQKRLTIVCSLTDKNRIEQKVYDILKGILGKNSINFVTTELSVDTIAQKVTKTDPSHVLIIKTTVGMTNAYVEKICKAKKPELAIMVLDKQFSTSPNPPLDCAIKELNELKDIRAEITRIYKKESVAS